MGLQGGEENMVGEEGSCVGGGGEVGRVDKKSSSGMRST